MSVSEEQQELRGLSAPRQSVFKRQWADPGPHCMSSAVSGQYCAMVNMSQDPSMQLSTGPHLAVFIWKVLAATATFLWADCHQQMDLQGKANIPGNQPP